jgi:hypothetical protein
MRGILSNLSSNRENNFLKIKDEANKPNIVIKAIKIENEINVFKNELPVKPANENNPSKNWNNLKNNKTVIPMGIKISKPCKKYLKKLLMLNPIYSFF